MAEFTTDGTCDVAVELKTQGVPFHVAWAKHGQSVEKLVSAGYENPPGASYLAPEELGREGLDFTLCFVCQHGWDDVALALMEKGADVNFVDHNGDFALLHACDRMHDKIAMHLLERGASLHLRGEGNLSALHFAAARGMATVVDELLNHGHEVDPLTESGGETPLHRTCEECARLSSPTDSERAPVPIESYLRIVRALLTRGADPNKEDNYQVTPLYSLMGQYLTVVQNRTHIHNKHQDEDQDQDKVESVESIDNEICSRLFAMMGAILAGGAAVPQEHTQDIALEAILTPFRKTTTK